MSTSWGYARLAAGVILASRSYRSTPPTDIRTVLVVELGDIGDAVLATAVIRAVKARFPGAKIDVCARRHTSELLGSLREVNQICRIADIPNDRRYDLAIDLNYFPTWTLLRRRAAHSLLHRGGTILRSRISRHRPLHELQAKLEVVRCLGIAPPKWRPLIALSAVYEAKVTAKLIQAGVEKGETIVVFHPGAAWQFRRWPVDRFLQVAEALVEKHMARIIIIGGKDERVLGDQFRSRGFLNWTGELCLLSLAALMKRASLFVGNDSGPMHIAAAMDTPVVALFGPQLPGRFGPVAAQSAVLHHQVTCCPCLQRSCIRPNNPCISLISVEQVVEASERLLRASTKHSIENRDRRTATQTLL